MRGRRQHHGPQVHVQNVCHHRRRRRDYQRMNACMMHRHNQRTLQEATHQHTIRCLIVPLHVKKLLRWRFFYHKQFLNKTTKTRARVTRASMHLPFRDTFAHCVDTHVKVSATIVHCDIHRSSQLTTLQPSSSTSSSSSGPSSGPSSTIPVRPTCCSP